LHLQTALSPYKLIEVHGRLGLYKWYSFHPETWFARKTGLFFSLICLVSSITEDCIYAYDDSIEDIDLEDYAKEGTCMEAGNLILTEVLI